MIRINLLPFRAARKREDIKRQIIGYIAVVCLAFIIMGGVFYKLSSTLSGLKDDESRLKKELKGYQIELKEIKDLEKKIKQIEEKLGVIKKLEKGKTGPVLLLSDIADAVPKDKLWLKSLSEKNGTLSLSGTAMDKETVALFMTNLESADQITAPPELKSTAQRALAQSGLTVQDFVLQCKIYAAPKEKKNNKKKK